MDASKLNLDSSFCRRAVSSLSKNVQLTSFDLLTCASSITQESHQTTNLRNGISQSVKHCAYTRFTISQIKAKSIPQKGFLWGNNHRAKCPCGIQKT